jgi:hypothetical protein
VSADATPTAIRRAYLELAKRSHPNLFATDPEKYRSSNALMADINAAYELLSDPAQREFWDRRHHRAPKRAPQPAPAASHESELAHTVIRKYNQFVVSLRTPAEREEAARRIRKFQDSPDGSTYMRKLIAFHYQPVIDTLTRDRRVDRPVTVFDDGLVEIMLLYPGALEVAPSEVFITYAYILYKGNKATAVPGTPRPARRSPTPSDSAAPLLKLRYERGPTAPEPAKDLGARIWHWLLSKPEQKHR